MKQILLRLPESVYQDLLRMVGNLMAETGRKVSVNSLIVSLIEEAVKGGNEGAEKVTR